MLPGLTVPAWLAGMLQAMVAHDRVHRFFSTHAWSADQLGLVVARLLVATLLPAGAALDLAADDSLFRRRAAGTIRAAAPPAACDRTGPC
jgi:DDE superfamily endonuclease